MINNFLSRFSRKKLSNIKSSNKRYSTEYSKDDSETEPTVIGKGAYGCIVDFQNNPPICNPPLKYKNNTKYIHKLYFDKNNEDKNIKSELNEINNNPLTNNLDSPGICKTEINDICGLKGERSILPIEYGGIDLEKFVYYINSNDIELDKKKNY